MGRVVDGKVAVLQTGMACCRLANKAGECRVSLDGGCCAGTMRQDLPWGHWSAEHPRCLIRLPHNSFYVCSQKKAKAKQEDAFCKATYPEVRAAALLLRPKQGALPATPGLVA